MIAANVMTTDLKTLTEDTTVRDAMKLFEGSGLNDFPVVNSDYHPIGMVTARAILHFAVPDYASNQILASMKVGPDIESVYDNLKAILDCPISKVIRGDFTSVNPNTPTSAVAAMLTHLQGDSRNILVVDDTGKLVGIISARDILLCRKLHLEHS